MGGREEEVRLVRSIFTDWRVQTERQSENSSRGKQGNLFQKTLQGVSAKSHTILSAANVCVAVVSHQELNILKCLDASSKGKSLMCNLTSSLEKCLFCPEIVTSLRPLQLKGHAKLDWPKNKSSLSSLVKPPTGSHLFSIVWMKTKSQHNNILVDYPHIYCNNLYDANCA